MRPTSQSQAPALPPNQTLFERSRSSPDEELVPTSHPQGRRGRPQGRRAREPTPTEIAGLPDEYPSGKSPGRTIVEDDCATSETIARTALDRQHRPGAITGAEERGQRALFPCALP